MSWSTSDVIAAIAPVVEVLEQLAVRYRIGGSIASSALGLPRSTLDADIACELRMVQVDAFVARLQDRCYVDPDMVRDAGCGKRINASNSRGHHKERWADGGKTDDANHAEVCKACHKKLHE